MAKETKTKLTLRNRVGKASRGSIEQLRRDKTPTCRMAQPSPTTGLFRAPKLHLLLSESAARAQSQELTFLALKDSISVCVGELCLPYLSPVQWLSQLHLGPRCQVKVLSFLQGGKNAKYLSPVCSMCDPVHVRSHACVGESPRLKLDVFLSCSFHFFFF